MSNIKYSIDELVGHTPLMELKNYEEKNACQAHLLAKLEYMNPSGSIKDRASFQMIKAAQEEGVIQPGDTIVEQTSGNTGIGLAAFANAHGFQMEIFLEKGASKERRLMLEAYGVKLLDYRDALGIEKPTNTEWVEPEREATLREIKDYCDRQEKRHYFINQVVNLNNPKAHKLTTGPEIWEDTDGQVDYLVCMAGTGGTALGLSEYLREKNPHIKLVLVQPSLQSFQTEDIIDGVLPFEGVKEEDITDFVKDTVYDEWIQVETKDAYATARELVQAEGLFMGTSSAAALYAATIIAKRSENANKNIVIIMPDNGMKYLSTHLFAGK